jgi:hypothetical protein
MGKLEYDTTAESDAEGTAPSKSRKPQALRFEKQTIRTLSGTELKMVSGGTSTIIVTCITSWTATHRTE